MAIYDYKCSSCENVQEVMHSIVKSPRVKCNLCNSSCKKIISTGITGGPKTREIWDYNDIHKYKPKYLKSRDGKTRVRYDSSKHGAAKGRG